MTVPLWAHRSPPTRRRDSSTIGRWRPVTLADITAARRQLNATLHDGARPAGAAEGAVQLLLLAFEELTSNALRHGRLPIEVTVTRFGPCWLLEVSDAAADRPPAPAVGRDPALGGLGLPLVATISADHGWTVADDRKVVWATMERTSEDPPHPGVHGLRTAGSRRSHGH